MCKHACMLAFVCIKMHSHLRARAIHRYTHASMHTCKSTKARVCACTYFYYAQLASRSYTSCAVVASPSLSVADDDAVLSLHDRWHACVYACMHTCMHACTHACMHARTHERMCGVDEDDAVF